MVMKSNFYAGSRLFTPISDVVGLPIDKMNFLVCQIAALGLAIPFRTYLSPSKTSPKIRHCVELVTGLLLAGFCFGYQVLHLIVPSSASYAIMKFVNCRISHKVVFVVVLGYLSVAHIYRQIYDYGGYTLDITGPLMIMTQKLTSMAFSLSDGMLDDNTKLTEDQRNQAIRKLPGLLEFFSFLFCFHGIMCGPLCFYRDYIAFIEGTNYTPPKPKNGNDVKIQAEPPSPKGPVIEKLTIAAVCGLLMMFVVPYFPPERLTTREYLEETTFLQRSIFLLICGTLARCQYYFAWVSSDALNNAAGLGFSGYDEEGKEKWDLINNVDIYRLEMATSLKVNIDCWNKMTLIWLRRVVYDRSPRAYSTLTVFAVSAIWHGFYPGYYLTFGSAALCTVAARLVRRNVRGYFQSSPSLAFFYDCVTFMFTRIVNVYLAVPFLILELVPCLQLFWAFYAWVHFGSLGIIIFFMLIWPKFTKRKSPKLEEKTQ
ncbi:lysophospholipid acyltransferase 6-like [Liolophura sinensis]|uniref:lysophospholipid acyltransferase 6-like n=1 Tax=Liolophura sinensis TaxID=3198878 RepID=UPI00315886B2